MDKLMGVFLVSTLILLGSTIQAETKYRKRFNLPEENGKIEEKTPESKEVKAKKEEKKGVKTKELSEMERAQKILERYKPVIQKRTYADLKTVKEWAPDLKLNRLPDLNEGFIPGRAPNIKLIPYLLKSFEHPAYKATLNGVSYYMAVNCDDPHSFDDCSTTPHNKFKSKEVFVRFIQSEDKNFNLVKGMRVGQTFSQVSYLFDDKADIHGDGECLKTKEQWLACFEGDKLAINKTRLQMMPSSASKLTRFLKISGRAY
jgi:hypothetical protein